MTKFHPDLSEDKRTVPNQTKNKSDNAGYNNGIEAGRRDRQRGAYYDINSQREFQRASKDYSSRLGDRNLYAEYFRLAFQRGYDTGYQGY